MTLIVGEESYISVDDADAYVVKWHGALAEWDDASTEAKERALRIGSRYVDSHNFKGYRATETQSLAWPRIGIGVIDGQVFEYNETPQPIKEATVEAALKQIQGEVLFPDHDGATIKSESAGVGPMSRSYTYQGAKKPGKVFDAVRKLLEPFLARGAELKRGIG